VREKKEGENEKEERQHEWKVDGKHCRTVSLSFPSLLGQGKGRASFEGRKVEYLPSRREGQSGEGSLVAY